MIKKRLIFGLIIKYLSILIELAYYITSHMIIKIYDIIQSLNFIIISIILLNEKYFRSYLYRY